MNNESKLINDNMNIDYPALLYVNINHKSDFCDIKPKT